MVAIGTGGDVTPGTIAGVHTGDGTDVSAGRGGDGVSTAGVAREATPLPGTDVGVVTSGATTAAGVGAVPNGFSRVHAAAPNASNARVKIRFIVRAISL
jgi:hypothetical protein